MWGACMPPSGHGTRPVSIIPSGTPSPAECVSRPRMRIARGSAGSTTFGVRMFRRRPIRRYGPAVWGGVMPRSVIVRLLAWRRVLAADDDVPAEAERPSRLRQLEITGGDHPLAGLRA